MVVGVPLSAHLHNTERSSIFRVNDSIITHNVETKVDNRGQERMDYSMPQPRRSVLLLFVCIKGLRGDRAQHFHPSLLIIYTRRGTTVAKPNAKQTTLLLSMMYHMQRTPLRTTRKIYFDFWDQSTRFQVDNDNDVDDWAIVMSHVHSNSTQWYNGDTTYHRHSPHTVARLPIGHIYTWSHALGITTTSHKGNSIGSNIPKHNVIRCRFQPRMHMLTV